MSLVSKLISKAKCNESIAVNLARLPRDHAAFQAGRQGSKSDPAFQVKGINLNRPSEDTGGVPGHLCTRETTLKCASGSPCSVCSKGPRPQSAQHAGATLLSGARLPEVGPAPETSPERTNKRNNSSDVSPIIPGLLRAQSLTQHSSLSPLHERARLPHN